LDRNLTARMKVFKFYRETILAIVVAANQRDLPLSSEVWDVIAFDFVAEFLRRL
jgi:hypothetical protein